MEGRNESDGNVEKCLKNISHSTELESTDSQIQNSEQRKPQLAEGSSIKETRSNAADQVNYQEILSDKLIDQIKGVIYGNCIGDAVGLLTEFMSKEQARMVYGAVGKHFLTKDVNLEYEMKSDDSHRIRWVQGDWTDDSDQMILILQTLLERNGQFDKVLFAHKMLEWCKKGFPELGDTGGMGRGMTTVKVLEHQDYKTDPHKAAHDIWVKSNYYIAPNGGVMRTSILGTMEYHDLTKVIENTKNACKVTHADPRCVASCVAVTRAIALMLQGKHKLKNGEYDVHAITREAHEFAEQELEKDEHVGVHYVC